MKTWDNVRYILITASATLAGKNPKTTQGWISEWGGGAPRSKRVAFWNPEWVELRWHATCVCQQEPESLFCMCLCPRYTRHSKNKRRWQEKRKDQKKIERTPRWPLTPGARKGPPRMHTEEVQTEFMTALSLLLLITSPPISGHWEPPCRSRQARHHSFTRLLGAFVRWLLGGKRKTDQYISHGPDR